MRMTLRPRWSRTLRVGDLLARHCCNTLVDQLVVSRPALRSARCDGGAQRRVAIRGRAFVRSQAMKVAQSSLACDVEEVSDERCVSCRRLEARG